MRSSNDLIFTNGQVFYKHNDSRRWHRPGTVIGQESNQILVKHGGTYVHVHSCWLIDAGNVNFQGEVEGVIDGSSKAVEEAFCGGETTRNIEIIQLEGKVLADNDLEIADTDTNTNADTNGVLNATDDVEGVDTASDSAVAVVLIEQGREQDVALPKLQTRIRYRLHDDDVWKKGIVYSKAGKVGKNRNGKHTSCLNIMDEVLGNVTWHDFGKDVDEWLPLTEGEGEVLISDDHHQ